MHKHDTMPQQHSEETECPERVSPPSIPPHETRSKPLGREAIKERPGRNEEPKLWGWTATRNDVRESSSKLGDAAPLQGSGAEDMNQHSWTACRPRARAQDSRITSEHKIPANLIVTRNIAPTAETRCPSEPRSAQRMHCRKNLSSR